MGGEKGKKGREGSSTIMESEGRGMWFTFKASSLLPIQASLVAQTKKNLPAMEETWVQSLGWEDPLEKGMANYSSILAWEIP